MIKIKPEKKLETLVETFDFNLFFNEYNVKQGYIIERNNEYIYNLNNLIRESEAQKQHFLDTGKNFFMVIRRLEEVEVHKNGSFDHRLNTDSVVVNKDDTIDLKYIKGLNDGDYVEFYFDD